MREELKISLRDFEVDQYHVINDILVHKEINVNDKIYKYIDIYYLIEMLDSQSLYVANRKSFTDRREQGYKENLRNKFMLRPAIVSEEDNCFYDELSKKINQAYNLCVSCWTYGHHNKSNESILNWKCYGRNAVRIETTINCLISSIYPREKAIIIKKVNYDDEKITGTVDSAIFTKHLAYEDEKEIRLCVLSTEHHEDLKIDNETLIKKILLSPLLSKRFNLILKYGLENSFDFLREKIELSHLIEFL